MRLLMVAVAFVLAAVGLGARDVAAQAQRPVVLVAPLEGTVDPGMAPFVERAIGEAQAAGAAALVLEIDTFGGRLDSAVAIRDRLLESPVRTVAFVRPRAISAGALIALASETIAVSGGATIGAATPVQIQPDGVSRPVEEKTVSYVRKEFAATAEQRGRPVELAEAMVDADVVVPRYAEAGKLLTLTGAQALELGVADVPAENVEELLAALDLGGAEVRTLQLNWAEHLVRGVTSPVIASLLMSLGMLGLLIEMRTPGFGVPGILGVAFLALFFAGHWIVRLAGFEEIALVTIGLALLAVEVFVTPGFGLAGILGIAALVAGLGMSLMGAGATAGAVLWSVARVTVSFVLALAAMVALLAILPRSRLVRGIVLDTQLAPAPESQRVVAEPTWVGEVGTAMTPLRPAGTAQFRGARVDVVSEGPFILQGELVEAIRQEGNRVVVRQVPHADEGGPERVSRT